MCVYVYIYICIYIYIEREMFIVGLGQDDQRGGLDPKRFLVGLEAQRRGLQRALAIISSITSVIIISITIMCYV